MRTAAEIIQNYDGTSNGWETTWTYDGCIKMINEARKEAIEEIAEFSENYFLRYVCENDCGIKEKILEKINELK